MKALALAAAVAAGVVCSAGTADAQYRSRGSYRYVAPTYVAPAYSYGYTAPSYYGGYSGVVTSGYTTPFVSDYAPVVYPSSYSYPSYGGYYGSSYYGGYNSGFYNSGYYNNGLSITPSGAYWGGRRIGRW